MNDFIVWLQKNYTLILIFGIFCIFFISFLSFKAGEVFSKASLSRKIKEEREDAINRSKAVLTGFAAEQMAPFLPDFPCNPGDCRFVGKPVDYIAFPGSSEDKEINEIVLIEVKTGTSQLSKREREIKECVKKGKFRYVEYYI